MTTRLSIETQGKGLVECTSAVDEAVRATGVQHGVCVVFVQHTSASLTIQENADPSARRDIEGWLERTVREDDPAWTHVDEGPDDMPSHIRAALTSTTLSIPFQEGQLTLGTWQGTYLWEHRRRGSTRRLVLHLGR